MLNGSSPLGFGVGRRAWIPFVLCAAFGLGACDDERGTINDPDLPPAGPDSDFIFGSAHASAAVFRLQNDVVEKLVEILNKGATLPVEYPASSGIGTLTVYPDGGPGRFWVEFANYQDVDIEPVFDLIEGVIRVRIDQTAPGLDFTINPGISEIMPYGGSAFGMLITLTPEAGGLTIFASGEVHGKLVNADAAGLQGIVEQTGTMRIDGQGFLIVETLATEFEYDGRVEGSFSRFPAGSYTASFFAGGIAAAPFSIAFDGFGRISYPYRDGTCDGNLLDLESGNSCGGH